MASLWSGLSAWLVGEALAQVGDAPPQPPRSGVDLPILQTFGALFLIVGLLLLAFWLLRRYGGRLGLGLPGRRGLRLVEQLSLGGRRGVVVVRHQDRLLVLGVTDHHITLLTETDVSDESPSDDGARFASALDDASRGDDATGRS